MRPSLFLGPAREALLLFARSHSQADELKCHALLTVVEACDALKLSLRREIAAHGLTEPGFVLLAHFIENPGSSAAPGELARALPLSRQVVVEALGRLEISGLIARERSDKRRSGFETKVTAAGRRTFSSALSHYLQSIGKVMSALDEQEIKSLDFACIRLRESAEHAA